MIQRREASAFLDGVCSSGMPTAGSAVRSFSPGIPQVELHSTGLDVLTDCVLAGS